MGPLNVTYFTAGTIGAGHLARGIAIERALARASLQVNFTILGPPSPFILAERASYRPVPIDPRELFDRARARESLLAKALVDLAPDVLLVDLFWAPLLHVLPLVSAEVWLLVRRVPTDWFVGPDGHGFDRRQFARVIGIEPGVDGVDETIDPVVLVNPDERRPRGALRRELALAPDDRLVVVEHAAVIDECRVLLDYVDGPAHVFTLPRRGQAGPASRFPVAHHDGGRFFPLAEWLDDADEIVIGGGYNAFWETQLLRRTDKTRAVAFPRPLDDQAWRIATHRTTLPCANGADTLARTLIQRTSKSIDGQRSPSS